MRRSKQRLPESARPGGEFVHRSSWWSVVVVCAVLLAAWVSTVALEAAESCEQQANGVLVRVHGVRSAQGSLVAVLYGDKPDEFLKKGGRVLRERVPAQAGTVPVCLAAPRPGTYAVVVYHDENDSRKFERSWTGLPTEGFGVSNNPKPVLRAPTHSESAIQVKAGQQVVNIDLRY
jgi:uncharacterized protein (DUF2141 family)